VGIPACATVGSPFRDRGQQRYEQGLAALTAGDYATANEHLGWVAEQFPDEEVGRQALLLTSALEMDPRNPSRRLALGSDLAAGYMRLKNAPTWTQPLAQTLYVLSLELGAAEEKVAQAEAQKQQAERQAAMVSTALPKLPQNAATVPARIRDLQEARDKLAKKVDQLEALVAERDRKLKEQEAELERIKKTVKR